MPVSRPAIWGGVAAAALFLLAPLVARWFCRALGLVRPNFRGDRIPGAVGITFLLVAVGLYVPLSQSPNPFGKAALLFLFVSVGFGLLGLADDLWGTRAVGGFRGHANALLRGRLTTGMAKLLGGGAIALAATWQLRGARPEALLDALLIALSANALNLLDVRPGRALFGFVLLAVPTLGLVAWRGGGNGGVLLGALMAAVLVEWPWDARGRAMMGDTGSNLLGAAAGFAAAIELPLAGKAVLLGSLLLLNVAAERVSLSQVIARTPWLAFIDRHLGVR